MVVGEVAVVVVGGDGECPEGGCSWPGLGGHGVGGLFWRVEGWNAKMGAGSRLIKAQHGKGMECWLEDRASWKSKGQAVGGLDPRTA